MADQTNMGPRKYNLLKCNECDPSCQILMEADVLKTIKHEKVCRAPKIRCILSDTWTPDFKDTGEVRIKYVEKKSKR